MYPYLSKTRVLGSALLLSLASSPALSATLSDEDVTSLWDRGPLATAIPNAFDSLAGAISTLWSMPVFSSTQLPPLHVLGTLVVILTAMVWIVPRLPSHVDLRRWLGI